MRAAREAAKPAAATRLQAVRRGQLARRCQRCEESSRHVKPVSSAPTPPRADSKRQVVKAARREAAARRDAERAAKAEAEREASARAATLLPKEAEAAKGGKVKEAAKEAEAANQAAKEDEAAKEAAEAQTAALRAAVQAKMAKLTKYTPTDAESSRYAACVPVCSPCVLMIACARTE